MSILDIAKAAGVDFKRRGAEHVGLCPFHQEKTPSFHVHPDKGVFYCHGCGLGGDAETLALALGGDVEAARAQAPTRAARRRAQIPAEPPYLPHELVASELADQAFLSRIPREHRGGFLSSAQARRRLFGY